MWKGKKPNNENQTPQTQVSSYLTIWIFLFFKQFCLHYKTVYTVVC